MVQWNETDLRLLRTVDLFQQKPGILKKAEEGLNKINLTLQNFLKNNRGPCPEEADSSKGQIARGENHKGFPYLSLDMPQLLNKEVFYCFRVLFWWGNYLGFSLILKGGQFDLFRSHLVKNRSGSETEDILFSVSNSPWEWGLGEKTFLLLNQMSEDAIDLHCDQNQFIKLLKTFPMDQPGFQDIDWTCSGVESYRQMVALISD